MEKTYKRCDQLFNECNMILNNGQYVGRNVINRDFNVSMIEIQFSSDEEWNKIIEFLKFELKRRKEG